MNGDLILIIPVLLIIVAIMFLVRHMKGGTDDSIAALIGIVPIVIIIGVAIGIIVSMASIADPWEWDADSKTLTIDGNIHNTGLSYPWTGYANQVETLVIEPGVEFVQGPAFARMTNLEYVDIAAGVTLDDGAFSQTFKDPFDADIAIADVAGYEYVGEGNGVLYRCEASIFTFSNDKRYITGLQSDASGAKYVGIPRNNGNQMIVGLSSSAFASNATIELLAFSKQSEAKTIGTFVCKDCTALVTALLPESIESFGTDSFRNCTALTTFDIPDKALTFGQAMFRGDTSLTSFEIPDGTTSIPNQMFFSSGITTISIPDSVTTIGSSVFNGCSALEAIALPASVTEIGNTAFNGCTGITSVSFQAGFAATLTNCFPSWTFYDSDGTTVLDKTVASNLAGKTFQGTAAALVEVAPDQLTLTPDQIQQVRLHDAELERIKLEAISIGPLPFELQDA